MKSPGLLISLAASAILVIVAAYPLVHNYYLHPLARLANSISEGDDCDPLRERFVHYVLKEGSPAAQQHETTTTKDLLETSGVEPSFILSLVDESLFNAPQLSIRCGLRSGQVVEKLFIAD